MQVRNFVTFSATALLLSAAASLAQDEMTSDSLVGVSVEGTMVEVPVSLAAQACGLDEATIMANAFTEMMDAQEVSEDTTVAPDPMETTEDATSSDGTAATDMASDPADMSDTEAQVDGSVADEATTAAAVGEGTRGVADTATTADNSADSATADEAAETVDGIEAVDSAGAAGTAVCEVNQATAEQFGFPVAG